MKYLKKFESFTMKSKCSNCDCDCDECNCDNCDCDSHDSYDSHEEETSVVERKKAKPDFLDLDKDGDKKESMKKAAAEAKSGKKATTGLTAKQKKLPPALQKAILARKKK
jgi:hypothetical protein